jgi:hypothetical protein
VGGVATGVAPGETVITATYGGKTAQTTVTVKEGCFIATAACGSYLDPHVQVLRSFRDGVLLKFSPGRWLVAQYYRNSPPLAAAIAQSEPLRVAARAILTPVVYVVEYPKAGGVILLLAVGVMLLLRKLLLRKSLQKKQTF